MINRKSRIRRPDQIPRCTSHAARRAKSDENAAAVSPYTSVLRRATPFTPEKTYSKWLVVNAVLTGNVSVNALTTSDP